MTKVIEQTDFRRRRIGISQGCFSLVSLRDFSIIVSELKC
jgi:hypothetical protein